MSITPPTPRHRARSGRARAVRRTAVRLGVAALAVVLTPALGVAATAPATAPSTAPSRVGAPGPGDLSNGCRYDARGMPACGAYFGAAHGANTLPTALEQQSGSRLGVRRTYFTGSQVEGAVRTARADLAAGRLPWISFKLPRSWEEMASGRGDAWAADLARRLATLDGPVWVAFHHEPENDGDIQAWRRMQERLAPLVRRIAPNVAYTVILTGWHQRFGEEKYHLDQVWPRGVKIDVAGFDVYNEYGVVKRGKRISTPPHLRTNYFEPLQAWAAEHDTAWAIAETGLTHEASVRYPRWIEGTYRSLVQHGGVAYAYFDTEVNAYGSWPLTTDTKRSSFTEALRRSPLLPR